MSDAMLMQLAMIIPLTGAVAIALAGRISPNVREAVTLITAGALAWVVWSVAPVVYNGGRPGFTLTELVPGIDIAFQAEPLGMLFAALAKWALARD